MDSWDQGTRLFGASPYESCTWSRCGRFVAASSDEGVEIRDALSSELVSTLAESDVRRSRRLAYSSDGHLLACVSDTLVISDIQTGGTAKKIQHSPSSDGPIVWSLDGRTIGTILEHRDTSECYGMHVYDVASCTTWSHSTLQSSEVPRLWTHNNSFRIMATSVSRRDDGGFRGFSDFVTVKIFEVGFDLIAIESFHLKLSAWDQTIGTFSPTTYRVSFWRANQVRISDLRDSESLLEEVGRFRYHCFSSDGTLFAASLPKYIHIWKHTPHCYTPWRKLPTQGLLLRHFPDFLQVYRLDGPPIVTHPDCDAPLAVLSPCGAYIVTAREWGRTAAITNLRSPTAPQFIDTGMELRLLAVTGNILLVHDTKVVTAWRLTEEGLVDGVFGGRRAGRGDSIWTVSISYDPVFMADGQTATIGKCKNGVHVYHTGTGEVIEPAQTPAHRSHWYDCQDLSFGRHYLHRHRLDRQGVPSEGNWPVSLATLQGGWVRDTEGKHRLWIPIEWRAPLPNSGWFSNITTLRLEFRDPRIVIIMF